MASFGQSDDIAANFAQELADLAQTGQRLRHSHPELAKHLTRTANNPDIERLIEGTAFLCAQVRARVDACAPQFVREMAHMMAPWVQRCLPATAVLGIDVPLTHAADIAHLPAKTTFKSARGRQGLAFRTTRDVALLPVRIHSQSMQNDGPHGLTLTLCLKTNGRLSHQALAQHGLQFYIDGPEDTAQLLAMALWHGDTRAELHDGHGFAAHPCTLDRPTTPTGSSLTPSFADDPPIPSGIASLRDLFILPQAALFARCRLAMATDDLFFGEDLTLTLTLGNNFGLPDCSEGLQLRLHAVPAVNLVRVDAMPLRLKPAQSRYVLRPQTGDASEAHVLAVDEAHVMGEHGKTRQDVPPLHSYRWAQDAGSIPRPMHTLELPEGAAGPAHLHVQYAQDALQPLEPSTLSARLWCHNGHGAASVPAQELALTAGHARGYSATNLTPTTAVVPALSGNASRFALLSLLGQRSRCALTADDVRRTLKLLQAAHPSDSPAFRSQQLLIASIAQVSTQQSTRLWHGAHVLCLDITLELDCTGLRNIAQAYLFADSLAHMWADGMPVHGVTRMHMVCRGWGRSITWPLQSGHESFGKTTCTLADERR